MLFKSWIATKLRLVARFSFPRAMKTGELD
jgi:hypothetical protein